MSRDGAFQSPAAASDTPFPVNLFLHAAQRRHSAVVLRPRRNARAFVSLTHAFVQNLRRGHYEITAELPVHERVRAAFDELTRCL